jgi:hypothetical protein
MNGIYGTIKRPNLQMMSVEEGEEVQSNDTDSIK